ncbi:MAG: Crp/Fnr family transcriptional regulator [Candidatus Curtissbacteria bacterium]
MKNDFLHELDRFFSKFRLLHFKKGEAILRPGDVPGGVFYLKKGYVRLYSVSKNGEELTLIIFKPGDLFPITWAINDTLNLYFLEAMTVVEVRKAPREGFLSFARGSPEIYFELSSRMMSRLDGLLRRMEYLVFGNAYAKVASIILICAERFGEAGRGGVAIQVPLTHNDVASLVGVTRETASVEIKKLKDRGLIANKGKKIIVKNASGLRKASNIEDITD